MMSFWRTSCFMMPDSSVQISSGNYGARLGKQGNYWENAESIPECKKHGGMKQIYLEILRIS